MINLVVALPAEARPLIARYRLTDKSTCGGFRIYRNAGMSLVISGPGKVAAAAASALLAACNGAAAQAAWLNIGIAGHATHATGHGLLAHRITDHATGKSWYPPQLFDLKMTTTSLLTVDRPENDYQRDIAYDMEASGYYATAVRFSSAELVQCFKVVSDNRDHSSADITVQGCAQLITQSLDDIDPLLDALAALVQDLHGWHAMPAGLEQLCRQWHFSVSQRHQLAELARRWKVLVPDQILWLDALASSRNATEVLQCLQQQLDSLAPGLLQATHEPHV